MRGFWGRNTIHTDDGVPIELRIAPGWNDDYFINRMDNESRSNMVKVLDGVKNRRNNSTFSWRFSNNTFTIYRNDHNNTSYHDPYLHNVNELVFERLRNGKPEPTEWNSGRPQTAGVWTT